jgi:hypothetical protein
MGLLLHWNTNAKIAEFFFLLDHPLTFSHFYIDVTSNLFEQLFCAAAIFVSHKLFSFSRNFSLYSIADFFTVIIL